MYRVNLSSQDRPAAVQLQHSVQRIYGFLVTDYLLTSLSIWSLKGESHRGASPGAEAEIYVRLWRHRWWKAADSGGTAFSTNPWHWPRASGKVFYWLIVTLCFTLWCLLMQIWIKPIWLKNHFNLESTWKQKHEWHLFFKAGLKERNFLID